MKTVLLLVIFFSSAVTCQSFASPASFQVVRTGPSYVSPPIATLFHQNSNQVAQCSYHTDPNGVVWTQIRVQGWVPVRIGHRQLLNPSGSNRWKVVTDSRDSQPIMVGCKERGIPVCQLNPFTVVCGKHTSRMQEYVYASFTGCVINT